VPYEKPNSSLRTVGFFNLLKVSILHKYLSLIWTKQLAMENKIIFEFSAIVWQYSAPGGWFFISLPENITKEIREHLLFLQESWGRFRVRAKIGNSVWDTAIWYDKKSTTYFLPLKSDIRKAENIQIGSEISLVLGI